MKTEHYQFVGDPEIAKGQYETFKKVLGQFLDPAGLEGDLNGKWIVFKDGWVYGMAGYPSESAAMSFAHQMFRTDAVAERNFIIVRVDAELHKVSNLHLLASAFDRIDETGIPNE